MDEQAKKLKWAIVRFVISIIVLAVVVVVFVVREGNQAQELKEQLVENCQASPVRETLVEILETEIKESKGPLTAKVGEALHLTPQEVEEIVSAQNQKRQHRINQIEPSDCESQYEK